MKKIIDIKEEDVQPLKIMAVKEGKDLKNFIQDKLSEISKSGNCSYHQTKNRFNGL